MQRVTASGDFILFYFWDKTCYGVNLFVMLLEYYILVYLNSLAQTSLLAFILIEKFDFIQRTNYIITIVFRALDEPKLLR